MTEKQKLVKQINLAVTAYKTNTKLVNKLNKIGLLNPDGEFHSSLWKAFDLLMQAIDVEHGDQFWLDWYVTELTGAKSCKSRKVTIGKQEFIVSSPNTLADAIIASKALQSE